MHLNLTSSWTLFACGHKIWILNLLIDDSAHPAISLKKVALAKHHIRDISLFAYCLTLTVSALLSASDLPLLASASSS